jgi:hypothetical protein
VVACRVAQRLCGGDECSQRVIQAMRAFLDVGRAQTHEDVDLKRFAQSAALGLLGAALLVTACSGGTSGS